MLKKQRFDDENPTRCHPRDHGRGPLTVNATILPRAWGVNRHPSARSSSNSRPRALVARRGVALPGLAGPFVVDGHRQARGVGQMALDPEVRPRAVPVEGRAPADVLAWLATTPRSWREQIRYVAIDMSPGYRAAVRTGLPHATVVVDHFHVVQLANTMLNSVRRRTTTTLRGDAAGPATRSGRPAVGSCATADTSTPRKFEDPQWSSVGGRAGRCRQGPPGGLPPRDGQPPQARFSITP
jgi:transposase